MFDLASTEIFDNMKILFNRDVLRNTCNGLFRMTSYFT